MEELFAKEGAKLQAVCQKAMPLIERKVADEEDLYMAVFCGIVQHSPTLAGAVRRVRAALEQEAEEMLPGRSALLAAVRSKVPAALRRVGNLELNYYR